MDANEFFRQQFGGERFVDIIGDISIAQDFQEILTKSDGNAQKAQSNQPELSLHERVQIRAQRVKRLGDTLATKLTAYTDAFPVSDTATPTPLAHSGISWSSAQIDYDIYGDTESPRSKALADFRAKISEEAQQLKQESFGVELLHAVGFTYSLKAAQARAKLDAKMGDSMVKRWMGAGNSWASFVREKAHIATETVGTFKTAIDLQSSFSKIQEIDKRKESDADSAASGTGAANSHKSKTSSRLPESLAEGPRGADGLTDAEREFRALLEKEAAAKGMEALWRGSKLEIESVLRDVCDLVLSETEVKDVEILQRRVEALGVIGEIYTGVKADEEEAPASPPAA
ncbi:hypothetical protein HDU77_011604 [Chytriomyces hyalinus]|nr:hypothetical protein HDU77_011604 [Chytriomyces hyalinus]